MRKLPVQQRPTRKLLGAVIAAALLIPNAGFTLGLGEIEVNSGLNQRLNADIELLSASPEDTETLIIKLASRKEFSRAGLDRPYSLNDLSFKSQIIDGVPYIKVSSTSPIREPFLNFLVEIDWPNGHLLREYTVLLDPPVFMTQSASTASAQSGGAPSSAGFRPTSGGSGNVVAVVPVAAGISASARPASTSQAPASAVQAPQTQNWVAAPVLQQQTSINQPAGSYKIKSGDTAWSLADAMRPDQSITVPQMMIAMLRNNPESFINENINGLKRGYILRVPDYNQITSISNADALALVREQAALWRQYQQSQSGGQPVSAMEADDMGAAGEMSDSSADSANDAYLEIGSAGTGSSTLSGKDPTQMSAEELRSELAYARERVESELVEKEALQHRVDTLQNHVDKMKGMLSIEDEELAGVQELGMSADAEMVGDEAANDSMTEDAMSEGMVADGAEVDMSDESAIADANLDEAIESEEMEGEAAEGDMAEDGALFVDEDSAAMPEQSEPAMDMDASDTSEPYQPDPIINRKPTDPLSELLNDPMLLAAAGGGLLLLLAVIGLIIKRRKAAAEETSDEPEMVDGFDDLESIADDIADEVEEDEVTSLAGDADAEDFDSDSTMILDSAEDTIIAEPDEPVESDEPRDDVIAEADVYLAYGIYQQAEELLAQAISDNPDRDDYRVKLAETHYASKNAEAFADVATDLKSRVSDDSASWKKVVGMGQDLCADNPMFQGSMVGSVDVGLSSDAPEMDFDLGLDGEADSPDLDLSLGDDDNVLELPDVEEDEASSDSLDELEFDLSETDAVEESSADDEFSLDIDASELDIDIKDDEASDNAEISLDLSDEDIGLDEVVSDDGLDIDFGLDDTDKDKGDKAETSLDDEEISLDLTEEAAELDMDFGEDEPAADDTAKAAPAPSADLDDEEDFDLSALDDVDEISTKLDLARAYLDMGDHEGTKGILEEVLADGNDEQKQEANELMSKLD